MVKLTFSVDEDTARRLRRLAHRTKKPQSLIVREAIARYADSPDDARIPEAERDRQLRIIREMRSRSPNRTAEEADAELRELRESRHAPHRGHPAE